MGIVKWNGYKTLPPFCLFPDGPGMNSADDHCLASSPICAAIAMAAARESTPNLL